MYDIRALYEAQTVEEALALRREHPGARLIAGGSDLLIKIRDGKLPDAELISIRGIDSLRGVSLEADGTVRIGPLTSFTELTRDGIIKERLRVLADAAGEVGSPQIRNIGTVGGNICNGATSADTASTLFALDAKLELRGGSGTRLLDIAGFYLGAGRTDVREDELLTGILIGRESLERCHGCYIKYSMRSALDIAVLGCSVNLRLSADGAHIDRLRLAFGVAGPVPSRCPQTELAFAGAPLGEDTARQLARSAVSELSPRDSWRASRAFRLHVAEESAYLAFCECVRRAGGAI